MTEPRKPKRERKSTNTKTPIRRTRISDETNEFVYAICSRYMEQATGSDKDNPQGGKSSNKGITSTIAEWARNKFNRPDITREKIYPYIWEGFRRGFVSLNPPKTEELRDQLIKKFNLSSVLEECGGDVYVTDVTDEESVAKNVSFQAAETIIELLKSIKDQHEKEVKENPERFDPNEDFRVHVGFGAGYVAMEVAKRLATRNDKHIPKLTLHAITSSYYLDEPEKDASTYFSYFTQKRLDVKCVAFNTTPILCCKPDQIAEHWNNPSLKFSYEQRNEIDVVVTSLADAKDEHGLLKKYFSALDINENVIEQLEKEGWVGDLLFNPFSENGPIFPENYQTAPLFSFNELVNLAHGKTLNDANIKAKPKRKRYVVLIGGPCADMHCKKTKEAALFPLLNNESMRVWTHLIIDSQTAKKLIELQEKKEDN